MSRKTVAIAVGVTGMLAGMLWYAQTVRQPPPDHVASEVPLQTNRALVSFDASTLRAEVVDTPEKRQQGLSGRRTLAEGEGMLFVFAESDYYTFWMPDMYIAIDILWLDEAGRVVYLKENATPESYPEHFRPDAPARYVLEVPSGYARAHGIQVGSQATIKLPATL